MAHPALLNLAKRAETIDAARDCVTAFAKAEVRLHTVHCMLYRAPRLPYLFLGNPMFKDNGYVLALIYYIDYNTGVYFRYIGPKYPTTYTAGCTTYTTVLGGLL